MKRKSDPMRIDLYPHIKPDSEVLARFDVLSDKLDLIIRNQETTMAAVDDLKAAIADLTTELADNNAEIEKLLTKITATGTSDADVAAAVASIRGLLADNKTEVDKAKAAAP